jgi:hypothetical protein
MRTTTALFAAALNGCVDQAPPVAASDRMDRADASRGPHVCQVLEPQEPDPVRLPPRPSRGGMVELPAPLEPGDPRDSCVMTNRCVMRATSGDLDWLGRVDDGLLFIGYLDAGAWWSTSVDVVSDDAVVSLSPDDDGIRVRIEDSLATRGYRLCVTR